MIDYVSPLVEKRIVNPESDFISVLAQGEREGVFSRDQVISNSSLLLLAGHETTINLLCNGILSFLHNPYQWELLRNDPEGMNVRAHRGMPEARFIGQVHHPHRFGGRGAAGQADQEGGPDPVVHLIGQPGPAQV